MDALHCKPVVNTAKSPSGTPTRSPSGTPTVAVSPSPSNRSRFTITITPTGWKIYDHAFLSLVGVEPGVQLFLCVHQQHCISLMDALHCKPVANTAKSPSGTPTRSPSGTPTVAVSPSPSNRSRFTITITPISSLERKIYTSTWRKLPIGWKLCAWIHFR